jgi:hypothetical protein
MAIQSVQTTGLTRIFDPHGRIVLEIGTTETRIQHEDGRIESVKNSDMIQTVCGAEWSPWQLSDKPPRHIAVCDLCRHPVSRTERSTHGIMLLTSATRCHCGVLCCPTHRTIDHDGRWACKRCGARHPLLRFADFLLFRRTR